MLKDYDPELLKRIHNAELEVLNEFDNICKSNGLQYFAFAGTAIGAVRHGGFIPWDDDIDLGMLREDYEKLKKIVAEKEDYNFRITTPETEPEYCSSIIKFQQNDTQFVPPYAVKDNAKLGIHVDIFVYDRISDDKKKAVKQIRKARRYARLMFLRKYADPEVPGTGLKASVQRILCKVIHYALAVLHISPRWMFKKFQENAQASNKEKTKYCTTFQSTKIENCRVRKSEIFPLVDMKFEDRTIPLLNGYDKSLTRIFGDYMVVPPKEKRINHAPAIIKFAGEEPIVL